MNPLTQLLFGRFLPLALTLWPTIGVHAQQVDFNRDVRRILSDNCYLCHGPDKQESKLRLDVAEVAMAKGALVPGRPEASEMMLRITSRDPDERMPPPDSNRRLHPSEIETLRRWIVEGAVYEKHWAFTPIPSAEAVQSHTTPSPWAAHPIDAIALARMKERGFAPSPPATRERWLRRVTFDLTGLPPSVSSIDAFLQDASPRAYERVVNRLLASPAFGEQMALSWLDLARYADTFGYDNDREMHMWPWRDWVIGAFNGNLPYDEFIRWQLAGDLLPYASSATPRPSPTSSGA